MKQATIVTDLSFGDCGKGATVDYLTRQAQAPVVVVRHNGGSQCGHNVVTPTGEHHCFNQFGSGTLAGAKTLLSRHMLFSPRRLLDESEHLAELGVTDPLGLIYADAQAVVITPYHEMANRLREALRGSERHGSCGLGIGECRSDELNDNVAMRVSYMHSGFSWHVLEQVRRSRLEEFRPFEEKLVDLGYAHLLGNLRDEDLSEEIVEFYKAISKCFHIVDGDQLLSQIEARGDMMIFEGAQGVLLDEDFGFHPHTTWTKTTDLNAHSIMSTCGFGGDIEHLGLIRPYQTRHGAGPLPTEDPKLGIMDEHNPYNPWQREFRVGHFDAVLTRYAIACCSRPIDSLVVNCVDHLERLERWHGCPAYADIYSNVIDYTPDIDITQCQPMYDHIYPTKILSWIEIQTDTPIRLVGVGPTAWDRRATA